MRSSVSSWKDFFRRLGFSFKRRRARSREELTKQQSTKHRRPLAQQLERRDDIGSLLILPLGFDDLLSPLTENVTSELSSFENVEFAQPNANPMGPPQLVNPIQITPTSSRNESSDDDTRSRPIQSSQA